MSSTAEAEVAVEVVEETGLVETIEVAEAEAEPQPEAAIEASVEEEPAAAEEAPAAEPEKPTDQPIVTVDITAETAHINLVRELRTKVKYAEIGVEDAKAVLKDCKEYYDQKVAALLEAIDAGPTRLPLFDQQPSPPAAEAATSTPAESHASVPNDDESWREVSISELGITGKLAESLTEAGLTTMGAIADWSSGGKLLTDIPGVGPKKAEKIEEATAEYWAKHPRFQAEEAEESSVEGDAEETSKFDIAYHEGADACRQGVPSMENPHPVDTPERDAWNSGWNTAFTKAEDHELDEAEEVSEDLDDDGNYVGEGAGLGEFDDI